MTDQTTATAECGEPADRRGYFRCGKPAGHTGDRHTADVAGGSYTWGYVPASQAAPTCCRCDPELCATDDTGQHCADQACGVCLHGCPASEGETCCLEGPSVVTVELPGVSR